MALLCQDLSFKHHRKTIIDHVNLELAKGQSLALYGPTGSGKTVLLLIFSGLMRPSSGKVIIDDLDVIKSPRKARRQIGLGVIPGFSPLLPKLTLEENLLLQAQVLKVKPRQTRVQGLLEWLGMKEYANTLAEELPAYVRAKASLAQALLNDAETLLLDEPEYQLTSEEILKFWELLDALKHKGKSIIVSTRYQEVAAKCDQTFNVALVKGGDLNASNAMGASRTQTALA